MKKLMIAVALGARVVSAFAETIDWPWTADDDAVLLGSGSLIEVRTTKDVSARSLRIKGGPFLFTGTKEMGIGAGGMSFDGADVTISNRLVNKASDAVFAFTNSIVHYRGTYVEPSAFTTTSKKSGVRIEMVNAGGMPGGMYWDCMAKKTGLQIGVEAQGCSFLLDGGGVSGGAVVTNMVKDSKGFHLGVGTDAHHNAAILREGAVFWDELGVNNAGNAVGRGAGANSNRLDIVGGEGFVTTFRTAYPGAIGSGGCTGNVVVVDGKGFAGSALWKCSAQPLSVGSGGGFGNELRVLDGGLVEGLALALGHGGVSNLVVVSGRNAVLRGGAGNTALAIGMGSEGSRSEGNCLLVENGGLVENFSKWNVAIGGHENNAYAADTIGNGVVVRKGGVFKSPTNVYVGRTKGEGCSASWNYVHVSGVGSEFAASSDKNLTLATATLNGSSDLVGATATNNEIVAENGAVIKARNVNVGTESTTTVPGGVSGNRVIARNGGKILTTDSGNGGWSVFQVGRAVDDGERPVVTGNEILAENGGILEARHFVTLSKGNKITIRNGGVLQTTVAEPEIAPAEPGDIVMENGVFSTRQNNCNVRLFETSVSATSFPNLTVRGKTAFRLTGVQTDVWHGSQDYVFEETSDPRHFVRLEMMDGATKYQGASGSDDTLTIGATGSMLCSNTTATVNLPFTLSGPLSVVNSSLTLTKTSVLDAPVTLVSATLELPAGTTLGGNFALTVGGELEDGRDVVTSVEDLAITATMPENWRLRKRATETGFAYYAKHVEPGLNVILR